VELALTGHGEVYKKFEKTEPNDDIEIYAISGHCPHCKQPFKVALNIEKDMGSS